MASGTASQDVAAELKAQMAAMGVELAAGAAATATAEEARGVLCRVVNRFANRSAMR